MSCKLAWPSDHDPLLLLRVEINTTSMGDLESMKRDCSMVLEAIQGHRGSSGDLCPAGKAEETRKWLGAARRES